MTDNSSKPLETTRRKFIAGSTAAVSTFFIGRPQAHAGDAEITLKFATVAAASGTPWSVHFNEIKKRVRKASRNRVKLQYEFGGAAGDEVTTLEQTKQGTLQLWAGSFGAFEKFAPELCAFELPYLFSSAKAADDVIDNKLWADIEQILDRAGFKLLFFSENGYRSLGTKFGVKSGADLNDKRVRVPQSFHMGQTLAAMGATPEPLPVTEVAEALQRGTVVGFENSALFSFASGWYKEITHFTRTRHCYQPAVVVANKAAFEALPDDVVTAIIGDPKAESAHSRQMVRALEQPLEDNLTRAGITVYTPTAGELDAFKRATSSVHSAWTDKFGTAFYDKIVNSL